jgi:hypothetical protein
MLAVYPADQLRTTIAIYALSRAAEFGYNLAEDEGWIWGPRGSSWERPWWWGSWLLFPFTSGQLLHAFVFDRDCFPKVCDVEFHVRYRANRRLGLWRFHPQEFSRVHPK